MQLATPWNLGYIAVGRGRTRGPRSPEDAFAPAATSCLAKSPLSLISTDWLVVLLAPPADGVRWPWEQGGDLV